MRSRSEIVIIIYYKTTNTEHWTAHGNKDAKINKIVYWERHMYKQKITDFNGLNKLL